MNKKKGFTLIELMIVVAIVALLASIAIPMYNAQSQKARRSDGMTKLMETASSQERWFNQQNLYSNMADPFNGSATVTSDGGHYVISVLTGNGGLTFTATATPQGAQLGDTDCGNLTINQLGQKDASGTLRSKCWY